MCPGFRCQQMAWCSLSSPMVMLVSCVNYLIIKIQWFFVITRDCRRFSTGSHDRFLCITPIGVCFEQWRASLAALLWAICNFCMCVFAADDHMTGQYSRCDKTRDWMTCFKVVGVTYFVHFLVTAMLLPILVTILSICFVHCKPESRTMPSNLVSFTCSTGWPANVRLNWTYVWIRTPLLLFLQCWVPVCYCWPSLLWL